MKDENARLRPLTAYMVQEETDRIRALAKDEGVSVSHYLRQKLKRLIPFEATTTNIQEDARKCRKTAKATGR